METQRSSVGWVRPEHLEPGGLPATCPKEQPCSLVLCPPKFFFSVFKSHPIKLAHFFYGNQTALVARIAQGTQRPPDHRAVLGTWLRGCALGLSCTGASPGSEQRPRSKRPVLCGAPQVRAALTPFPQPQQRMRLSCVLTAIFWKVSPSQGMSLAGTESRDFYSFISSGSLPLEQGCVSSLCLETPK